MKSLIGKFVSDLDSHSIYEEPKLSHDFEKETGKKACWPTHSIGNTSSTKGEFKGVEGELRGADHERCSYGWEIARSIEREYVGTDEGGKYNGRGFAFRASIEAIQKKGV